MLHFRCLFILHTQRHALVIVSNTNQTNIGGRVPRMLFICSTCNSPLFLLLSAVESKKRREVFGSDHIHTPTEWIACPLRFVLGSYYQQWWQVMRKENGGKWMLHKTFPSQFEEMMERKRRWILLNCAYRGIDLQEGPQINCVRPPCTVHLVIGFQYYGQQPTQAATLPRLSCRKHNVPVHILEPWGDVILSQ